MSEVKLRMAAKFRGLTHKQISEIEAGEPLEVSLFIGGREFPLDGIALTGGTSLRSALTQQRQRLDDTIKNHLAREAKMLEMTVQEARLSLVEKALYLDRFIDELSHANPD